MTASGPAGASAFAGFVFRFDHRPAPQGSYKPIPLKNSAGAYTGKVRMKASSSSLADYRSGLATVVQFGRRGVVLDEPVGAVIRWRFRPPAKSIAGARCPETGAVWPATTSTGDVDKLTRAVLDALKIGRAVVDDSRVVALDAMMAYEDHPNPHWDGDTFVQVMPISDYAQSRF